MAYFRTGNGSVDRRDTLAAAALRRLQLKYACLLSGGEHE